MHPCAVDLLDGLDHVCAVLDHQVDAGQRAELGDELAVLRDRGGEQLLGEVKRGLETADKGGRIMDVAYAASDPKSVAVDFSPVPPPKASPTNSPRPVPLQPAQRRPKLHRRLPSR